MMERSNKMIRGSVTAVVYQNEANGYSVIRFAQEDGEIITVVGTIPISNCCRTKIYFANSQFTRIY